MANRYLIAILLVITIGSSLECPANTNAIELHRVFGSDSGKETLEIWMDNSIIGQKIHTLVGTGKAYQETITPFCWPSGVYIFTLLSTESSGWNEGSFFYVLMNGIEYLRGSLEGLPRKEMTFSAVYLVPSSTQWRFSAQPPENPSWTQSETTWGFQNTGSFPVVSSTRYFVKSVTVLESFKKMPVVEVDIFTHEGFILYVNGVEVNRFNLPVTGVTSTTLCISQLDHGVWKRVTLAGKNNINRATFLISVEVHKNAATGYADDFKAVVVPVAQGETNLLVDTTIVSNTNPENKGDLYNVVDGKSDTCLTVTVPVNTNLELSFTLNADRRNWFNRYAIQSAPNRPASDPREWCLSGQKTDGIWIVLDCRSNEVFSQRRQMRLFELRGNNMAFKNLRLTVKKVLDDDERIWQIGGLFLYAYDQSSDSAISLSYFLSEQYYVGIDEINLFPRFSGYTDFIATPQFPQGILLFPDSGQIVGSITDAMVNVTNYNISAIFTATGIREDFKASLDIRRCDLSKMSMIEVRKYNVFGSKNDYVDITKNGIVKSTFSGEDAISTTTHKYCLERGIYEITLSHMFEYGWKEGSYVEIYLYYEDNASFLLGRKTLVGVPKESVQFTTDLALPDLAQTWHVFKNAGDPPALWMSSDIAEADWQNYNLLDGHGPAISTPVWFIRSKIQLKDIRTEVQSYQFDMYFRSGIVAYVNGVEIYRVNVPDGFVVANTTITGGAAAPYWHRRTGLRSDFNNGVNTIAFAVVNAPILGNVTIDFRVRLYMSLSSDVLSRTFAVTPEYSHIRTGYAVENLFDGDFRTASMMDRVTTAGIKQYWGVKFNDDSKELINRYCFVTNSIASRYDPRGWEVYGSKTGESDMSKWTLLSVLFNMQWNARGQRTCFNMIAVKSAYSHIRFVWKENVGQLPDSMFSLAEIELFTVEPTSITSNELMYSPSSQTIFFDSPMNSMQPLYTGYRECSVKETLPAGITMDPSSGVIGGTPISISAAQAYTVTCTNNAGVVKTTTVTLTVEGCALPKKPFSVWFPDVSVMGRNMWFEVKSSFSSIVNVPYFENYNSYAYTVCSDPKLFTLTLKTNGLYGYGDRYAVVRLADNRELFRLSTSSGVVTTSFEFNPFYSVDTQSTWVYNYGTQPVGNWTRNEGSSTTEWLSAKVGAFPATDTITQYYTTTFSVENPLKYVGYETQLRMQAGAIVYLNGVVIMYSNIPVGTVTNATMASAQYVVPQIRKNSGKNNAILKLVNVLAVEIHRGTAIPADNTFMLKLLLLTDGQTRMMEGVATASVPSVNGHEVSKALDSNMNTFMSHDGVCEGTSIHWSYDGANMHYINSYTVYSGDTCLNLLPAAWKVEGSRDGESWTLVDVRSNMEWTMGLDKMSFKFFNENNFSQFRFTVTQCQKSSASIKEYCPVIGLRLHDIQYGVASIDYSTICTGKDGFSTALSDSYSYAPCDQYFMGYKRRFCKNGVFNNVETLCTVSAPASFSYPQESYELVFNSTIAPAIIPAIVCADCSYTIAPLLPTGMTLSATTGVISGKPLNITVNTHYTIMASNVAGSSSLVLDILTTNVTVHCYMDLLNGWENTLVNTTAVKACPSSIHYEGNMTRLCLPGSPAVWAPEENHCQLLLPTITLVNTTYSFVKNEQITPIVPIISGSQITERSIQPNLPAGLYFDPGSASISGKPTQKIARSLFTITVKNKNGQVQKSLNITVTALVCASVDNWAETDAGDVAYRNCPQNKEGTWSRSCSPTNPPVWETPIDQCLFIKPVVSYPSSSYALKTNQAVTITPTVEFSVTSWQISTGLPVGLTFSASSGVISGTPSVVTVLTTLTITASNPDKVTQVTLSISVNIYRCSAEGNWPATDADLIATIDCDNKLLQEGKKTRPCVLTGTTVVWGEITDTCKYRAPQLQYPVSIINAQKGESIATVTPVIGNQIDSITIMPQLPDGLGFSSSSGSISGTPSGEASNKAYTVTARNIDKFTEAFLQIVVTVVACKPVDGWLLTEKGETAYMWCAGGVSGVQKRQCVAATDLVPEWGSVDNSGCIKNPGAEKPAEGHSFVRFILQLSGVTSSSFDAYAYAAVRRVLATGLGAAGVSELDVMLEAHSPGSFSVLATGTTVNARITTGIENGEKVQNAVMLFAKTTLSSKLRESNVAALGSASASVVESSFQIVKFSAMNSLASTLIIIVVILGVILLLIGAYCFIIRQRAAGSKKNHAKIAGDSRVGKRTAHGAIKGTRQKQYREEEEEEEERPKKSKKSKKYEEEEEEEERPRKSKKSKKYEEEEEERPKKSKKSKKYEEEEEEEERPKKSKKSKKYEDSA